MPYSIPKTAREMLNMLDQWLTDPTVKVAEKSNLVTVLSALRGPDNYIGKQEFTGHIRQDAFPLTYAAYLKTGGKDNWVTGWDWTKTAKFGVPEDPDNLVGLADHFYNHASEAWLALGHKSSRYLDPDEEP